MVFNRKAPITFRTLVGLFTSVSSHMPLQRVIVNKRRWAFGALVGLFTRMNPNMTFEMFLAGKSPLTLGTFIRSVHDYLLLRKEI